MPEYLTSTPVISTPSLDEARDAVTRTYLPQKLTGRQDGMDMRLNPATDRRMPLGYLTDGAEAELTMPATEGLRRLRLRPHAARRLRRVVGGFADGLRPPDPAEPDPAEPGPGGTAAQRSGAGAGHRRRHPQGVFQQSRFAQQYRDEFNELPSVTLRR